MHTHHVSQPMVKRVCVCFKWLCVVGVCVCVCVSTCLYQSEESVCVSACLWAECLLCQSVVVLYRCLGCKCAWLGCVCVFPCVDLSEAVCLSVCGGCVTETGVVVCLS